MFHNVCRLCLGSEELIWIFNDKMADNMKDVIHVTSGVEIRKSDPVTQMVCSTCCQITVKMFKFRTTSIKNDTDLKERFKLSQLKSDVKTEPPAAATSLNPALQASVNSVVNGNVSTAEAISPLLPKFQMPSKYKSAHPSIKNIIRENPNIKLPKIPLTSHFGAYITLLTNEVDDWYKERNCSDSDLVKIKKAAADYATTLEKEPKKRGRKRRTTDEDGGSSASASDKTFRHVPPQKQIKLNSETGEKTWTLSTRRLSETGIVQTEADSRTVTSIKAKDPTKANESVVSKEKKRCTSSLGAPFASSRVRSEKPRPKSSLGAPFASSGVRSEKPRPKSSLGAPFGSSRATRRVSDSESEITDASDCGNVKSNVTLTMDSNGVISNIKAKTDQNVDGSSVGSARTRRKTKTSAKATTAETNSFLNSMLQEGDSSKPGDTDLSLKSLLRSSKRKTKKSYVELDYDSDDDDPSYDPTADASDAGDSDNEKEIEKPAGSTVEGSTRESPDTPQPVLTDTPKPFTSDAPQQVTSDATSQEAASQNSSQATPSTAEEPPNEKDFTLFTTRSFVRATEESKEREKGKHPTYKLRIERTDKETELLVLTDSESEEGGPTIVSVEGADGQENERVSNAADKECFVKSLDLAPASTDSPSKRPSNQPDLSLVSVANKSSTLHICRICDSHHHTLKELKTHQKRTHTKCPFCNKRFRSLATRDEHVRFTCVINTVPLKLAKIELTRVDEIEEIRKKYPKAFDSLGNQDEVTESSVPLGVGAVGSVSPQLESGVSGSSETGSGVARANEPVLDAVKELERFLRSDQASSEQNVISETKTSDDNSSTKTAESVKENVPSSNGDIICISDEEGDAPDKTVNSANKDKPKINIVNHDILQGVDLRESDMNVLKQIVMEATSRKMAKNYNLLSDNAIIDGTTSKVKIFKNLRKHLKNYKIPVEISHSPTLNVDYKYRSEPPTRKVADLWYTMIAQDLKYYHNRPLGTVHPTEGGSNYTLGPQRQTSNLARPPPPLTYTKNTKAIAPSTSTQKTVVYQALATSSSSVISKPSVFQTTTNDVQGQMVQLSGVQGNAAAVSYSSGPVINSYNVQTYTSSAPIILNSAQNLRTSAASSSSYVIVPGSFVTTSGNVTSPPVAQASVPVIQPVTGGQETGALASKVAVCPPLSMLPPPPPPSSSSGSSMQQPTIRVRNLSELS